jgi:ribosomal-protein-serine acetyltransferase
VEGRALPLLLRRKGAIVGSVGARIDAYAGTAELGYWVDADAEGHGLVRRGLERVIRHLLDDLKVRRIEIRTSTHNTRSRALSERLGFSLEGVVREAIQVGDNIHDVALYSLLAPRNRIESSADRTIVKPRLADAVTHTVQDIRLCYRYGHCGEVRPVVG